MGRAKLRRIEYREATPPPPGITYQVAAFDADTGQQLTDQQIFEGYLLLNAIGYNVKSKNGRTPAFAEVTDIGSASVELTAPDGTRSLIHRQLFHSNYELD